MKHWPRHIAALAVAIVAAAALAIIAVWHTAAAAQAWLAAYLFWAGLPIGALFLALAHGLIGGDWGWTLRPVLVAMLRTMPLLALLLVPALIGLRLIYPWATGSSGGWLSPPFFIARAVLYVVLWNVLALGALRQARPDATLSPGLAWPALILLFVSASLAAFDWIMTLEPRWTSTIFGLLITAGWAITGCTAALAIASRYAAVRSGELLEAPAGILLALILLWGYLSVIQLIVIWESDLSDEILWYLRRDTAGWQWVALAIAVFGFAVPFLTLMWKPLRRSAPVVRAAALSVLGAHLAEIWWLTVPDFARPLGWADPLATVAIGAAFVYFAGRDVETRPLPPYRAPHADA